MSSLNDLDKSAAKLIRRYKDAYLYTIDLLEYQIERGLSERQARSTLNEIQNNLNELDEEAYKWSQEVFPEYYYSSIINIDSQASLLSGVNAFQGVSAPIHKRALESAVNDLYTDLAKNTTIMTNQAKKIIRDNSEKLITRMIITGESQRKIKRELKDQLIEKGVPSFKDAANREWKIERYSDMLIRTKSRLLHTEGTINRLNEYSERYNTNENFDLIQISSHGSSCWCGEYEGMVFSLSGKSERYPSIDTLPNQPYRIFHPNCKHVWLGYMPSLRGEGKVINSKWLNKDVKELNRIHYHANKKKA